MTIVYMGTPDFAVPALVALAQSGHEVAAVVTQPDKARDRGKKVQLTPVKAKALELGIPVLQPEKIKNNEEFYQELRNIAPDLIVVAAYGKILPKSILELPPLGCVNIHASLLPAWRGAAPIHRCVINGDRITGVTLMYMAEGMDTGDMIGSVTTEVGQKTTGELHEELAQLGAELLTKTLPEIESKSAPRTPQDDALATYAPMVFKQDGVLDYTRPVRELCCLVRGMNSWPGASTTCRGQVVKIWEAREVRSDEMRSLKAAEGKENAAPGTVIAVDKRGVFVAAGDGMLCISRLQFPGKRDVSVEEYIKGNTIETGVILGGE